MLRLQLCKYVGGCGGRALFTGGAGCDALCAAPHAGAVEFSKFSLWQFLVTVHHPMTYAAFANTPAEVSGLSTIISRTFWGLSR